MKKDIPYREQLLELSKLYKVPEIKSYIKSKKNLTTSQLELILLKNKIPLPAQSYSRKHVAEIKFKEQVITKEEAGIAKDAKYACSDAIQVDSFLVSEFKSGKLNV